MTISHFFSCFSFILYTHMHKKNNQRKTIIKKSSKVRNLVTKNILFFFPQGEIKGFTPARTQVHGSVVLLQQLMM